MLNTDSICLSHKEDPDGIISAVLIKQTFRSEIFLTDYNELIGTLKSIIKNHTFNQIFICDLSLKLSTADQFLELLSDINKNGTKIWFIDHHALTEELTKKLQDLNINIIYSDSDCTSAIIYENFKDNFKENAELLVSCACITDSMENGSIAQKIMKKNDKMFTMLNSALIWYTIKKNQNNAKTLLQVVNYLSSGKLPFEITPKLDDFNNFLHEEFELAEYIHNNAKHYKNFDCLKIHDKKLSNSASKLLSGSEKSACLVHTELDNGLAQELVIMSSKNNTKNIGLITNSLSNKFNGSGGGDPYRSAAIIPTVNFQKFLTSLDVELE